MKILAAAAIATVVRIHPGDTDGLNRCYDAAANNSSSDVVECQLQPGTLSVFLLKSPPLLTYYVLLTLPAPSPLLNHPLCFELANYLVG